MKPTKPLVAAFIGSRSMLIHCCELFQQHGHIIHTVISSDSAVEQWTAKQQMRCLNPNDNPAEQLLASGEPIDYLFSVVHLSLLPLDLLRLPLVAAINFHDGPLPEYAGLNTTSWAIINQANEYGITWHKMEENVDSGDIMKRVRFPVEIDETALSLNAKCYDAGIAAFKELVVELGDASKSYQPQDLTRRQYFSRHLRPTAAGTIDWSRPATELAALVRGLDFGPYDNPLTTAKAWIDRTPIVVAKLTVLPNQSKQTPGTITAISDNSISVATGDFDVQLLEFKSLTGQPITVSELRDQFHIESRKCFDHLALDDAKSLAQIDGHVAKHESYWRDRLGDQETVEIPYATRRAADRQAKLISNEITLPLEFFQQTWDQLAGDVLLAAFAAYLSRLGRKPRLTLPLRHHDGLNATTFPTVALFAQYVPLTFEVNQADTFDSHLARFRREVQDCVSHGTYSLDLSQRMADLKRAAESPAPESSVVLERVSIASPGHSPEAVLHVAIADDGGMVWTHDQGSLSDQHVTRMEDQFCQFLRDLIEFNGPLEQMRICSSDEQLEISQKWNDTEQTYDRQLTVPHAFEKQVRLTPDQTALIFRSMAISYSELNDRANRFAHYLIEQGVSRGDLIGVMMDRSDEMVVAMFAILKAGGAYVPLDPSYPKNRLAFMIVDAELSYVVSQSKYIGFLPEADRLLISIDALKSEIANHSVDNPQVGSTARDLAYVIYTSGSTGKPKGVMVEHGNVINFFVGMDDRVPVDKDSTLLSVTSISFDISVLEIFWTLSRGLRVVLFSGAAEGEPPASSTVAENDKPVGFSLFYFSSDESKEGQDKYALLLEGAKFADQHDFEAVWTPERHFHAFGGLYPNPSVTSAALAAITEKVRIRAGSCVLPLHSPIRVAEEWSIVDNISNGRVDISFAAGWQPADFVLSPDNYENRHQACYDGIDTVRRLWRGETCRFTGPKGESDVRILPRPVQEELPVWITAAGNPETFRRGGELGANMLTHLLGQSLDELAAKIAIYRQAREDAGHAGPGQVSLMLHTFVADDEEYARDQVREPMKEYLRSSTNLLKDYAESFPAFRGSGRDGIGDAFQQLSGDDLDALLDHAFNRYYETSGLFGTPQRCMKMVRQIQAIGVDEIACLIDFGIDSQIVLAHLKQLNDLRMVANQTKHRQEEDSIGSLIVQHNVSHLQCTPSMARMLLQDSLTREGLGRLSCMMVGGEAMSSELATELLDVLNGRLINMYGPTETTIWSTTHEVTQAEDSISIGCPIANTQIHIRDAACQPLPIGVAGELMIGGAGLTRGYLNRPELSAHAFVTDPTATNETLYRTGDLAKWREDGRLEFLGRMDTQIKLRGYRMELGEIESAVLKHPGIHEGVVVVREDGGDKRLVGYIVGKNGSTPAAKDLKAFLSRDLPSFMIPASFVTMKSLPLTPNKKVDKSRLPAPESSRPELATDYVQPRTANEELFAKFFAETLGIGQVGIHDSFIELGGDSLSAIDLFLRIKAQFFVDFPLHLLLQFPTVAALVRELEELLDNDDSDETADISELIRREEF